jgi:hypothetical protein
MHEIDDPDTQSLLIELRAEVVGADGELDANESLVLRAGLEHWVLPSADEARVAPLVYGLDFEVVPRRRVSPRC